MDTQGATIIPSADALTSSAPGWVETPLRLKFVMAGVVVRIVPLSGLMWNAPFDSLSTDPSEPVPPFDELRSGVRVACVRSHPIERRLPRIAFTGGAVRYVPSQYRRYWIELQGSFAAYLGKFHSKTRNTLRRKIRKFRELSAGSIIWREFRTPEEMGDFYRLARKVSAKTYQETLLDAGFGGQPGFREKLMRLAERDAVRGYLLFHGERAIAYIYALAEGDSLVYERTGYDPDFCKHDPGVVLFYLVLERLFAERHFRRFDLGRGEYPYKQAHATGSRLCADLYYFAATPASLRLVLTHSAAEICMAWAKAVMGHLRLKGRIKRLVRRQR